MATIISQVIHEHKIEMDKLTKLLKEARELINDLELCAGDDHGLDIRIDEFLETTKNY